MLYAILKIPAILALHIYCRIIRINKKELLQLNGPMILASNHPNSFLDAIILCTLFRRPIYSLARGDAFTNKRIAWLLDKLNILPIYRIKEGQKHLHRNYDTFDSCLEIFKKNGIVLIFSEAFCENEWHLRTIKNGTARLAISAWEQNIPVKILPIGINYSSFTLFGKNIHLNIGNIINQSDIQIPVTDSGKLKNEITQQLQTQLHSLVYEIKQNDEDTIKKIFTSPISLFKKIVFAIPATIGYLIHAPLYIPLRNYIRKKALGSGHYDAILAAAVCITYPLYLLLISSMIYWLAGSWWFLIVFFALPFCAWSYIQLKKQTDY